MDRHGVLERGVGCARVHHIEEAVDRLVAAGPQDRGAQDCEPASATTCMNPFVSPFSIARETRVIGRSPSRTAGRRARLRDGHPHAPKRGIDVEAIGGNAGTVHDHRPVLLRGSNEFWLFPGENGRHKTLTTLGEQITDAVKDRVGIRVTPHQYRHAAAALIMRATQDYELARRVLGHKQSSDHHEVLSRA